MKFTVEINDSQIEQVIRHCHYDSIERHENYPDKPIRERANIMHGAAMDIESAIRDAVAKIVLCQSTLTGFTVAGTAQSKDVKDWTTKQSTRAKLFPTVYREDVS